jgi:hypothetical protein
MKLLVLEIPEEHNNRSLYTSVEESIKIEGGESELVVTLQQADLALQRKKFEGVIIHHANYTSLDYLKKKYPAMKFSAISAIILSEKECPLGSMPWVFRKSLEKHYDFLLEDYDKSIWAMMNSLKQNT